MAIIRSIVLAAIAVSLVSCSDDNSASNGEKVFKFKVAHTLTKNTHCHKGLEYFCQLLKDRSEGRLQPTLYSSGELGDSRSLLEGLQLGTIQIASTAVAPLSTFDSRFMVCDMPFLFVGHEHAEAVLDGPIGREIAEKLPNKAKMRVLAYWVSGFRSVFNTKGPIEKIDDLKELKIRVMETPVHIDAFNALGAIPTPMSFGELYTSLAQGVVDAAENDADAFWSQRFYEVCKYYSLTRHAYTAIALTVSEDFFRKLPQDLQEIVRQAAIESRDYERKVAKQMNDEALEKLAQAGVAINELDTAAFREAMLPVYAKYEKQIDSDILQIILKEQK